MELVRIFYLTETYNTTATTSVVQHYTRHRLNVYYFSSMEEFMDAHINHQSTRNNLPVAPFFFPKSKPSGPDLVFFIRIDGDRVVPVFVQMKLHQGTSNFSEKDWNDALSTVSAAKIEGHAKNFRKYCPDNVYISMIVAYPTKWTDKLPTPLDLPKITVVFSKS
ncbi:MAG: hypothetical protein BYD32DRAFT_435238 [Podila humilis]|nr:MAG: hypothetical protein BYD32DRAFT_435238 [Podila humilis]